MMADEEERQREEERRIEWHRQEEVEERERYMKEVPELGRQGKERMEMKDRIEEWNKYQKRQEEILSPDQSGLFVAMRFCDRSCRAFCD